MSVKFPNGGRVKRILRHRNHEAGFFARSTRQQNLHYGFDRVTGARCQMYILPIAWHAFVSSLDKSCHVLPHASYALALCVRANTKALAIVQKTSRLFFYVVGKFGLV